MSTLSGTPHPDGELGRRLMSKFLPCPLIRLVESYLDPVPQRILVPLDGLRRHLPAIIYLLKVAREKATTVKICIVSRFAMPPALDRLVDCTLIAAHAKGLKRWRQLNPHLRLLQHDFLEQIRDFVCANSGWLVLDHRVAPQLALYNQWMKWLR